MVEPFSTPRDAALALLNKGEVSWREGTFLGGAAVADRPLSAKQLAWISRLLVRHELPPMDGGKA